MNLVNDFKPFYSNLNDPGPKVIEFEAHPHPEISNWKPVLGSAKLQNRLASDNSHIVQEMFQPGWTQDIVNHGPRMRFEPAQTGYALIDVNDDIKNFEIDQSGWRIVKWEIVATDLNGQDVDKVEVDRRVSAGEDFFICDKLTWELGDTEVTTKQGYQHYK